MNNRLMVGLGFRSYRTPSSVVKDCTAPVSKSAEIYTFPVVKLPQLPDYCKACAELIAKTFPAPSRHGVAKRAALELPIASVDTYERIVARDTKSPDGHLMQCVCIVAASRGIAIPAELAVRS